METSDWKRLVCDPLPLRPPHRRGASEDLRAHAGSFEDTEESQRPQSYQDSSKHRQRTSEVEGVPSSSKAPVSLRSPKSPNFNTNLVNENLVGLPTRPNVYRRSMDSSPVEPETEHSPHLRTHQGSSAQSPSQSEHCRRPRTPNPVAISHDSPHVNRIRIGRHSTPGKDRRASR